MPIFFNSGSGRALAATLTSVAALAALVSCSTLPGGGDVPPPLKAAEGASLRACGILAERFTFADTQIQSSDWVAPTMPAAMGSLTLAGKPVADHCLVKGSMFKRKGSDGRDYAIGFEMRLPKDWNGRFFYQGNGGLDGVVQVAQGLAMRAHSTGALSQGFAVISSDAGHNGPQTPFFGAEPQARLDYGYQAVGKLTPMAKALIAAAYGKGPDRSYIGGCSNGGRHTLVAAARYGDQYDGYLAGAPGYRLPNAALAQLWGAQQWQDLATPGVITKHPLNPNGTLPDFGTAFTAQERQAVANAILDKCDALDGAKDGLVQATQACQAAFSVQSDVPTCSGARTGSCLTPAQKTVVSSIFAGGKTSSGQTIYSSFPLDPGLAGNDWATWKFVNALALDPLSVGTVFRSSVGPIDPSKANINELLDQFSGTSDVYKESGLSLMTPPGNDNPVNLSSLRARGAKIVVYHGVSDPIFSAEDTRQWVERVNAVQGNNLVRYFPVPGMNHCGGGPATDQFDLLKPLVDWVERGIAPQAVVAQARGADNPVAVNAELPKNWSPARTRPLCAYPTVARYNGSGDVEDAGNFSCK
jgi:Tannase and feruloyl esterase